MDIKLIVTDLDDTVVGAGGEISPRTVCTFSRCKVAGIHTAVATARSWLGAHGAAKALGAEFVVCSNGSRLFYEGDPVHEEPLGTELTARLIGALKKLPSIQDIAAETALGVYHNRKDLPPGHPYHWGSQTDFEGEFRLSAFQIFAGIGAEEDARRLEELIPDCGCIHFRETSRYVFVKKGVTKLGGIEKLAGRLGITMDQIAAFGDDLGDIGMLRACGCGVAMENGLNEVKAAARFVTGACENDGVAEFIETMILSGA